jgi:hypothetical protein
MYVSSQPFGRDTGGELFVSLPLPITIDTGLVVFRTFGASQATGAFGPHDATSITGVRCT